MRPKTLRPWKTGELITEARLNEMVEAIVRAQVTLGQNSGLDAQITPYGTMLRVTQRFGGFPGVANGNITARSGTTAGTGTVTTVSVSGTTISSPGPDVSVINLSSNTMTSGNGIDSGQYVWVELGPDGNYYVAPLECS